MAGVPLDRLRQRNRPVLSIVVPVYNGAQHLDEALTSIRQQDYRRLDIVVIDDGSSDDSLAIAKRHARSDRRVTVLAQANAGVGAARRAAVAAASGSYLTFIDADDTVTRGGIRAAMDVLEQTGSDLAVMPYQRLEASGLKPAAAWIRALHASPARHVTLEERPDVLVNAIACAKIFRREFWDRQALEFPTVLLAGDQIVTARAYRDANSIDISGAVAYNWRRMETSISQGQVTPEAVHARFDAIDAVLDLLTDLPDVRAERALQYLRYNVPNSTLKLERADDDYLDALFERVPLVAAAAPPDRYQVEVPAQHRVLNALLARGDRAATWRFVQAEGMQPEMHPTHESELGLVAQLPGIGVDDVPATAYVLTAEQTAAKAIVRGTHHDGPDLVLDVAVWFSNVELQEPSLQVKTDGDIADVVQWGEPHVVTSRQGAQRRYERSGWMVTLRGAAKRAPRSVTVTLTDGERSETVSASIPR